MIMRRLFQSTSMLCSAVGAVFLSTSVFAADLSYPTKAVADTSPWAVDGLNGKAETFGGSLANRSIYGSQGSFSAPLSNQTGLQVDGAIGNFDKRAFGSIGGHLFWRDPSKGLIGLYSSYTGWDQYGGVHVGQFGGEGEYYWQRWTLQAIAGVESGNSVGTSTTTTTVVPFPGNTTVSTLANGFNVKTRFFDQFNAKYYLTDDWNAFIGHRYLGGKNALALGSEYAFNVARGTKASAFFEARVGDANNHGVWGGLKFYFSPKDKPLIARQRQDDPNNWGVDNLFSITNSSTGSSSSTSCQSSNSTPGSCESSLPAQ